ncbi:tRNA (uracil-5-)-methyltransferase homolog B [Cherax quadricarinatus]
MLRSRGIILTLTRGLRGQVSSNRLKRASLGPREHISTEPVVEEGLARLRGENVTQPKRETSEEHSLNHHPKDDSRKIRAARYVPLSIPITAETQHDLLAQHVTPLCQKPYHKQLNIKQQQMFKVLHTLGKRLAQVQAPIERTTKGLPCPLESPRPSPDVISYRNKDELGIRSGVDGNPKTVGFFIGRPTDPLMVSVPPTYLINMRDSHKHIVKSFQNFIRESDHRACHHFDDGGIWRNLVVRSTQSGEKMAIVLIHPQQLPEDGIHEIMDELKRFFTEGEGSSCQLDSLYLQACKQTKCTREQAPYRLIAGKKHITETCCGLDFRISPDSFFQINTGGAEVLYRTVQEIAEVSPITTLLDICCGTGTVSLVMAPHVRGTIGIDEVTAAVQDAGENARANNISNSTFIPGKAEKVLPQLSRLLRECSDVVAVVNPARSGLHPDVIHTIRQSTAISKLIYISCKPEGYAMENFVKLGSTLGPKNMKDKSAPFVPRYAIPVDLFPHTNHMELVILFDRVTN